MHPTLTCGNPLVHLHFSFLGLFGLCPDREGANNRIGFYGTATGWVALRELVDQSCVQKVVWKDLFFSLIYFNLHRAGGGKRDDVRQKQCFHLPADSSYPHVLFAASSSSVLFCIIQIRLLYRETKNRFQDKIKTALKMHCVWQYLEQW